MILSDSKAFRIPEISTVFHEEGLFQQPRLLSTAAKIRGVNRLLGNFVLLRQLRLQATTRSAEADPRVEAYAWAR